MLDRRQRRAEVRKLEERACHLVAEDSGASTVTTNGMFPTILFYAYVLSFSFEFFFAVIVILWFHFDLYILKFLVNYSDGVS